MKMRAEVLSEEEIHIIHQNSLRILAEVGVHIPSEKALGLLETAGARIDWDKEIAYIEEPLVKKALATVPKSITLGARNASYDFRMPAEKTALNLDGCGVNVLDFETGKRRPAVLKDIENAAKIFEAIPDGAIYWSPVSPCEIPKEIRGITSSVAGFRNTSKHVQDEVTDLREVSYLMEIAKAIVGSESAVRERKIYSATYCTVAPLSHDREMLEATMELLRYDAPVLIYPMPACGSTGPASLYSNVASANAEALSALVVFQLAAPRSPQIYGAALGVINRRSGIFLEGAAETTLQLAAMTQMGKQYGLPTIIAGCLTDAKQPGMQSVMEKFLTSLPIYTAGADVIQGIGLIESSMTLSYEHMLIDAEIGRICNRLKNGIEVSVEKNFYEDIKAVGQNGHFLKQKTTRDNLRSDEFYSSELCDRGSYDEWTALGSPDLMQKARTQVAAILASEPEHPLDAQTDKVLAEILEEASRKLIEA